MDNIVWVATIAGIALGAVVILAFLLNQKNEATTGMTYQYDEQSRLQSVQPMNNNYVKLIPVGDNFE